ncbi:MAG: RNA polymerase sigma factor [Ignavibacteriaceae bacterium]
MLKSLRYKILIQQHKNRIYSYSYFMLRNRMDADDVTQEVFIRIWKNMETFNINKAKSWIMKTTHNLCLDYLRQRQSSTNRFIEINEEFENNFKEDDVLSDPEITLRREMIKSRIKEAVERLPDILRSVFVLYELEGMKYKEISEILNIPVNSVKVYLLRARKKLQVELKEFVHEKAF